MELKEFSTSEQRLIPKDALQDIYNKCKSIAPEDAKGRQRRGYALQNLLYSILFHEGLDPRTSYRPKGEEIDGAFYLDHRTFLLEARWRADLTSASDLGTFKIKVDGKLAGTLGIFISMNGYSEDAVPAFQIGKTINVILFDQSDMDAILIHGNELLKVLDFKLRQAGEVGKPYVPFDLPKEIAEAEVRGVAVRTLPIAKPPGIQPPEMVESYQPDVGYGEPLVLMLCEGTAEALILESIFRRLLTAKRMYSDVALEIKALGAGLKSLRRLPEIINIVQLNSRRLLSGVILVLDAKARDSSRVLELSQDIAEYISQMAMPVPFHLSFITPLTYIGLDKAIIPSGVEGQRLIQDAVDKISLDELYGNDIEDLFKFIREVIEFEEPLWQADARKAVERFLEEVEWDTEKGVVWLPIPPELQHKLTLQPKSVESLEDFHYKLEEVAMNGAANSMPYENGEPVFDIDYYGLVDEILIDDYEEQMKEMGWW